MNSWVADAPEISASSLMIDGEFTILRAAALKSMLLESIHAGQVLELDLSMVTEIDSAGVQLLLLARDAVRKVHGDLQLRACSDEVLAVIRMLRLEQVFGLPPEASAEGFGHAIVAPLPESAHESR